MQKGIIISDTHLRNKIHFPLDLETQLTKCDFIIHTGDFNTISTYNALSQYARIYGVYGNNDDDELRRLLPKKQLLSLNGVSIGLIHGDGLLKTTKQRAIEAFKNDIPDIIIFGHSHQALMEKNGSITLFNPGSPISKRLSKYFSFGIIEINDGYFNLKQIFF